RRAPGCADRAVAGAAALPGPTRAHIGIRVENCTLRERRADNGRPMALARGELHRATSGKARGGLPRPAADLYSPAMRISEAEITRLAESVVRALLAGGFVVPKAGEKDLVARVARLLLDDLRAEEALELEAEEMARKLGRQALGM